jgi:hypothetical protein
MEELNIQNLPLEFLVGAIERPGGHRHIGGGNHDHLAIALSGTTAPDADQRAENQEVA